MLPTVLSFASFDSTHIICKQVKPYHIHFQDSACYSTVDELSSAELKNTVYWGDKNSLSLKAAQQEPSTQQPKGRTDTDRGSLLRTAPSDPAHLLSWCGENSNQEARQ